MGAPGESLSFSTKKDPLLYLFPRGYYPNFWETFRIRVGVGFRELPAFASCPSEDGKDGRFWLFDYFARKTKANVINQVKMNIVYFQDSHT